MDSASLKSHSLERRLSTFLQRFFTLSEEILAAVLIRKDGRVSLRHQRRTKTQFSKTLLSSLNEVYKMSESMWADVPEWVYIEGRRKSALMQMVGDGNYIALLTTPFANIGKIISSGTNMFEDLCKELEFQKIYTIFSTFLYMMDQIYKNACILTTHAPLLWRKVKRRLNEETLVKFLKRRGHRISLKRKGWSFLASQDYKTVCQSMNKLISTFVQEAKGYVDKKAFSSICTSVCINGYLTLKSLIQLYNLPPIKSPLQ
jgi:predicted regulator of Ras-like GTPase activity (Roadblock/LC7/MglB family)